MNTMVTSILVAVCVTCGAARVNAQVAGQVLPKRITTDDMTPGKPGQVAPIKQPGVILPPPSVISPGVTILSPASGASYPVDTPVSFSGSFADEDGGTHAAQWTFELITAQGVVTETSGSVSGAWTFGIPGIYHVRLRVTDQSGNVGEASTVNGQDAFIVVFDRGDGFVDGHGRFDSPAGAFVANPSISGRFDFDFDARYRQEDLAPSGGTSFKFSGAGLDFEGGAYDWFVCFGARAIYTGTGTLNGAGNYAFLISAVDGDDLGGGAIDRLRIRITNQTNGAVVYDNQMGAPDTAAATCPLSWGNVNVRLPNGGIGHLSASPAVSPAAELQGLARGQDFVQNWPNPFRARTEVRFSLSQRSHVKLGVFDIAGREIATLADGPWDAGSHSVSWTGRATSGAAARGGVYFVRMSGGLAPGEHRFESVRKMILLD